MAPYRTLMLRRRLIALAVVAVAVTATATSCGSSSKSSAPAVVSTAAVSQAALRAASVDPAVAVQTQFVKVVHDTSPAVVQISTNVGLGSGVVYDNKGDIVTNAHVVKGAKTFTVTLLN